MASSSPYNNAYPFTPPNKLPDGSVEFHLAIIADQDKLSKNKTDTLTYSSYLKTGLFTINKDHTKARIAWNDDETNETTNITKAQSVPVEASVSSTQNVVNVPIRAGRAVQSQFAFGSRGMELSDLVAFNGKLYVCEDRTGIVFQLIGDEAVPWVILADGNGLRKKGFKCEWSIVKDEHLFVGSHSADIKFPDPAGPSVNAGQRWIKRISKDGQVEHIDWNHVYDAVERFLEIKPPGYVMHETVLWSECAKKWYLMPRQVSKEDYTDAKHPYTCANLLIVADERFTQFHSISIGKYDPLYGFTASRFVPGTSDTVIVALRVMEIEDLFATRIVVFNCVTGAVLLEEELVLDGFKYEGLEFV